MEMLNLRKFATETYNLLINKYDVISQHHIDKFDIILKKI